MWMKEDQWKHQVTHSTRLARLRTRETTNPSVERNDMFTKSGRLLPGRETEPARLILNEVSWDGKQGTNVGNSRMDLALGEAE
jgi:hypothetical protein